MPRMRKTVHVTNCLVAALVNGDCIREFVPGDPRWVPPDQEPKEEQKEESPD